MATRQEFCDAMIEVYKNHGVYIGTANGEYTETLTVGRIHEMEKTYARRDSKGNPLWDSDTRRDFAYIGKCYEQGWDMSKSRAGDCSGIIVGVMRDLSIISKTADYRARDFQAKSTPVELKDLQPADLVFDKKKDATHVGVYIGDGNAYVADGYVIESRGRDYGVVKRKLTEGHWVIGGRLDWFDDEIPVLTRELRYIEDDLMHGKDVEQCQERLVKKGYNPGPIDGYYGKKTEDAVIEFQTIEDLGIKRLGVVGQKTWAALWTD